MSKEITIDGVTYVPKSTAPAGLAQRCEVAEKFIADAQNLILHGRPQDICLRKLQAARNVLTGRVEEPVLSLKRRKSNGRR